MVPDTPLSPRTLPIILDTEIGGEPDDAMALVIAARELPELALVVTTDELGGERARFARFLLDRAGRTDVAVVAGSQLGATAPWFAHGLTPDWVTPPSGAVAQAVAQAAARAGGAARWIGLGPLSNLAGLLARQPGLARRLFVTQLAGTSDHLGQALPPRNFRLDPAAAQQVLAAAPHLRLVTFALPAGRQVQLTAASPAVRRLADAVPAGAGPSWESLLTAHLGQFFARYHPAVFPAGPLALAAALRLPFTSFSPARVTVGETGGMRTSPAELGSVVAVELEPDRGPGHVAQVTPAGRELLDQEQAVPVRGVAVALDLGPVVRGPVVDDLDHQAVGHVHDHHRDRAAGRARVRVQQGVGDQFRGEQGRRVGRFGADGALPGQSGHVGPGPGHLLRPPGHGQAAQHHRRWRHAGPIQPAPTPKCLMPASLPVTTAARFRAVSGPYRLIPRRYG
jgi:pyrimidine-specific ribonucleoside hydrolase